MSRDLERALRQAGIDMRVEQRERLAILVPRGDTPDLTSTVHRRTAVALAVEHGFTHLALELVD